MRIVLGLSLLPAVAGAATPSIGQVSRITGSQLGNAEAPGGAARKLATGDPIFAGERIRTGAGTVLQIEFSDKSRFLLGPNSEFEVGRYTYAPGGAEEDAFHSRIIKGAFRFVTGLIARSQGKNMKVSVAVATIGIRGTHVEGEVIERQEKDGRTVDASAKVALLEPEGSDAGSATLAMGTSTMRNLASCTFLSITRLLPFSPMTRSSFGRLKAAVCTPRLASPDEKTVFTTRIGASAPSFGLRCFGSIGRLFSIS